MLSSIQKDYAIIDKVAAECLGKLTGTNITKDIALSAEIAGLMLLRTSQVDLSTLPPGNVILGVISYDTYEQIQRFIVGWAVSNGLDSKEIAKVKIPDSVKNYIPEVTQFEHAFYEICRSHGIKAEYYPFIAISTAMKLVLAGEKMGLLNAKVGQAIVLYHIICGSKTVPCF